MLYFNAWAIASLICTLFTLLIFVFLVLIKNKASFTWILMGFFFGGLVLDSGYLWSALLPYPVGGYHRLATVFGSLFALICMIQFAYSFPRNYHPRESKIVLWITILVFLGATGEFFFKAITSDPDFVPGGDIFNFERAMGRRVAAALVLQILWFLVVMLRKFRRFQGEERRAVLQMMFAMLMPALVPAVVNVLFQTGRVEHGTFQQFFVIFTLLGYFAITIVFINNAVERTSFMTKIVGISVVSILLVIQGLSFFINQLNDENYDATRLLDAKFEVRSARSAEREKNKDLAYIISFPPNSQNSEEIRFEYIRKDLTDRVRKYGKEFLMTQAEYDRLFKEKKIKKHVRLTQGPRWFRQFTSGGTDIFLGFRLESGDRVHEVGYSYYGYRAFMHQRAKYIAYFALGAMLLILLLFPIFFSRSLVRPLNKLLDGVGEVNVGNLEVRIPVMVQDEIGFLSESFNRMVGSIMDAKNKLQDYANNLEEKVEERTREVTQKMEEIQTLKVQQDGDYFLTALIHKPLVTNWNKSAKVATSMYLEQKKKFNFRGKESELGGDICITGNLRFASEGKDVRHVVFVNGDAMGKSMQGAGGAIVLGTAMNNIMARSASADRVVEVTPSEWLTQTYNELHDVFKTFDGLMLASAVIGVINEQTGRMYYFNAEHPWTVLYRDGQASFIEDELILRKLGSPSEFEFQVQQYDLRPGDVLIAGSDGRDDINFTPDADTRTINEDETLFLRLVEQGKTNLNTIVGLLYGKGTITDDLSLLRIGYHEAEVPAAGGTGGESDAHGLYESGRRRLEEGDREGGLRDLKAAVELKPNLKEALQLLAQYYYERKDFQEAARWIEDFLEMQPDAANFWFYLSVCAKSMKDFEKARAAGEKVREFQPHRTANLINLADSYRILGDLENARKYVQEALNIESENDMARKLDGMLRARGH